MFDGLKKYINGEDYLVRLMNSKVDCYNYLSINKINNNEVIIKFPKIRLYLKGKDFILKKLDKSELLITGIITKIELR